MARWPALHYYDRCCPKLGDFEESEARRLYEVEFLPDTAPEGENVRFLAMLGEIALRFERPET